MIKKLGKRISNKLYEQTIKKAETAMLRPYLAGRFNPCDIYILSASPRSGSTWLGNILGAIPNSCVIFEPLHIRNVPEAKNAGFSMRSYAQPHEPWPEGKAFLQRVFEGRVVNDWTGRELTLGDAYKSKRSVVKFVRANRILPWICQHFDLPAPIMLMRHPCAVVASQLNLSWKDNAKRPIEPEYINKYPRFRQALSQTASSEEYLAALWALDQIPALTQLPPHPWTIVTYEELMLYPEATLHRIFNKWDIEIDMNDVLSRFAIPSSVVSKSGINGIEGWKKVLSNEQIEKILNTVESFGLSFYSRDAEANYDVLYSDSLHQDILKAGK